MITLSFTFWMFVILFGLIGSMRGWAKELLVTFGVILGLFLIAVCERFAPDTLRRFLLERGTAQFWVKSLVILVLVIFGYQTPNIQRIAQGHFAREKISDALLGFFIGALNGYLIVGTIWYFMEWANYPFAPHIRPPETTLAMMNYLPPKLLIASNSPLIYFGVAIAFVFVIVVFI